MSRDDRSLIIASFFFGFDAMGILWAIDDGSTARLALFAVTTFIQFVIVYCLTTWRADA